MKLLVLSPIDPDALAELAREHEVREAYSASREELKQLVADREGLIFRSGVELDAELLTCAHRLQLVVRAGSGFDNIDLAYLEEHGIRFARIPEPGAQAVAELTFALMLNLARRVLEADRLLRQGHWAKHEMMGYLLQGKVLGIVGAGNIGSRVGQLGAAWGMQPLGCVDRPSPAVRSQLAAKGIQLADFWEVVQQADFLTIHVPRTEATRHLINEHVLTRMKPGSFLVNVARGGVVDEQALYQALTRPDGLRGAALDVHEQEGEGHISSLALLPNVILTPHIGSCAVDTQRQIGQRVLELVREHCCERAPLAVSARQ